MSRHLKSKPKTGRGEQEEPSINWFRMFLALAAVLLLGFLLYAVVLDDWLNDEPEYVIVPFGDVPSPTAIMLPTPTSLIAPTSAPTLTPAPAVETVLVQENPITAFSASSVARIRDMAGSVGTVSSVAFSGNGRLLATAMQDGPIRLWDATTGSEVRTLQSGTNRFNSVAFSDDGLLLAAGGNDTAVHVWDVQLGQERSPLTGAQGAITSVAFSPLDGTLAAGSDDGQVYLWNPLTGTLATTLTGHTSFVTSIAFNADGSLLAAGGEDERVLVWKVDSGATLWTLEGHTGNITDVAFSPDSTLIASAATGPDLSIRLWDATTGQLLNTLTGHTENVTGVGFSPDGSLVVSAGGGIDDNSVRLWDASLGGLLKTLALPAPVNDVAFSEDGRLLAIGGANLLGLWSATEAVQPVQPVIQTPAGAAPLPTSGGIPSGDEQVYPTPDPSGCVLTTRLDSINLRSGPGTGYDIVSNVALGTALEADGWTTGAEEGFTWWHLVIDAWIRGDLVESPPEECFRLPAVTP